MNNWIEQFELDTNEESDVLKDASNVSVVIGGYAIRHLCKKLERT